MYRGSRHFFPVKSPLNLVGRLLKCHTTLLGGFSDYTSSKSISNHYPILMENENDRATIPGYVSIKEAAMMLGISANRVYAYVEEGRLPSAKAAHVIMIPLDAVEDFKPQLSGRPRASVPTWRISPEENTILATSILVRVRPHQRARLVSRLEDMRQTVILVKRRTRGCSS